MKNMKSVRTVTIVCSIVTVVALCTLVVWFIVSSAVSFGAGNWSFGFVSFGGQLEPRGTHSVPADNIDSLYIDWTAGAVYVFPHDGNDIQITEFSRRPLRSDEYLHFRTDGGRLTIHFVQSRVPRNMQSKQLEVLVPRALSAEFQSVDVNTVSGRIYVSAIDADRFSATTVSGRIELSGITAQTLNANTTSGRIDASRIDAPEVTLRTISGRIELANAQTHNLSANTTSGRIELLGDFVNINARTASGRIELRSGIVPDRLTANTASGRISITVPDTGVPISVNHSTGAGRFSSQLPMTTGVADAQFQLSTASGRIEIFALR